MSRGFDHSPLGCGAPGAVVMDAIRGKQCVSAGPGRERKEVAGQRSSPERHPSTKVRPPGDDRATTPRPWGSRRRPFPRQPLSPGAGGAGSTAPPHAPAPPGPHSPPAAVPVRRPGPRHSRLPRLQRLLPCPVLPHPLPAERAERDPSRAGSSGSEHVGPPRPEPEATARPASGPCWSQSRLWEVWPAGCGGSLCYWVEAWGSREPRAGKVGPGPLPPGPVPFATNQSTPWVWDSLPTS